jgi:ABC-type proline/glycine betaine transport system permease subunit
MLAILGLVLVGGVLVAYLWETLNQLMTGYVDWVRVLVSLPVLAAFALLLRFIGRRVEGWHEEPGH